MKRLAYLALALLAVACGAAPKHAEPAPMPATETPGAGMQPAAPSAEARSETFQLDLAGWQTQFDQTLADTDRLDCPNACRALGSLERSAGSICGIVGASSSTCQDVQKKRDDARDRVRQRCGPCR